MQAFNRSLALDSSFAPAVQHLSELAALLGDTAGIRRGLVTLLRLDSLSGNAASRRWHVAALLGDSTEVDAALASDSMATGFGGSYAVSIFALSTPLSLRGTESVFPRTNAQTSTQSDRDAVTDAWRVYNLIRGWPGRGPPFRGPEEEQHASSAAIMLFVGGDPTEGVRAGSALLRRIGTPLPPHGDAFARYIAGQYAIHTGQGAAARRAAADLRSVKTDPDSAWQAELPRAFAILLDAQLAESAASPDHQALDSVLQILRTLVSPVLRT